MKIGIFSDSHDNLVKINAAVSFFNAAQVGLVIHAGDFVAPFAVRAINKLHCRWRGVFGNNDGEKEGLSSVSEGRIAAPPLRFSLEKKKFTVVHDLAFLAGAFSGSDIVIYGHTHKAEIKTRNGILFINPGECGGWLSGKSTLALLDTSGPSAEIIEI